MSILKNELHLFGVTALYIACKYEEIYPPDVKDFVYITKQKFNSQNILQMELSILNTLSFNLTAPHPYIFLERYSNIV